jgi:PAS domain S-box-containing protein
MSEKPTYEELEQKIKNLVKEAEKRKRAEQMWYHFLMSATAIFSLYDSDLNLIEINDAGLEMFPGSTREDLIGKNIGVIIPDAKESGRYEAFQKVIETGEPFPPIDFSLPTSFGKFKYLNMKAFKVRDCLGIIALDITERKRIEMALMDSEADLKEKARSLEDANTALEVLLKKRERDKSELEKSMLLNVKELVMPYLEKLKKSPVNDRQEKLLEIVESHLNDIISPFIRKLSTKYLRLTPMEIQVANFIKHGKTTKEIAELLNLSDKTIETYRKNIRKKIGIRNKKTNLRTQLQSLR